MRPSKKENPNENYAREIMELHTVGAAVDDYPYTEQDVKEVARCFTGWSWAGGRSGVEYGEFIFRENDHDTGVKEVLGEFINSNQGKFDAEIVIDILCKHEATGKYLAEKMIRRFVTDDPHGQTPELVERVAQAYHTSDGDIKRDGLHHSHIQRIRQFLRKLWWTLLPTIRLYPSRASCRRSPGFSIPTW